MSGKRNPQRLFGIKIGFENDRIHITVDGFRFIIGVEDFKRSACAARYARNDNILE